MTQYRIIGGEHDGRWQRQFNDAPFVSLAKTIQGPPYFSEAFGPVTSHSIVAHRYRLETMHAPRQIFKLWRPEGDSLELMLQRLIDGYKP